MRCHNVLTLDSEGRSPPARRPFIRGLNIATISLYLQADRPCISCTVLFVAFGRRASEQDNMSAPSVDMLCGPPGRHRYSHHKRQTRVIRIQHEFNVYRQVSCIHTCTSCSADRLSLYWRSQPCLREIYAPLIFYQFLMFSDLDL